MENLGGILERGLQVRDPMPPDPPDFLPEDLPHDPSLETKAEFDKMIAESKSLNEDMAKVHEMEMQDYKENLKKKGVSLARVPVHGKGTGYVTSRPVTLEIEKGTPTKPIAEPGFQKTKYQELTKKDQAYLDSLKDEANAAHKKIDEHRKTMPTFNTEDFPYSYQKYTDALGKYNEEYDRLFNDWSDKVKYHQKAMIHAYQKPNPHFEFEERTKGENIPPERIKAIHVDRQKLTSRYGIYIHKYLKQIQELGKKYNLPVFIHNKTVDLQNWQAAKSKLPKLYAKGGKVKEPTRALVAEKGPEIVQRGAEKELVLHPRLMGLGKGYKVLAPSQVLT